MATPKAVLLDSGGIFVLPDHRRILDAFERGQRRVSADVLDDAHYRAAASFTTDLDVEADWAGSWRKYLAVYIDACGVAGDDVEEVHRHVDNEFADAAVWVHEVPGCRDGLAALSATGVRLGIVSNADGLMASRLREREILQVGPGVGIPVDCVIDSGDVGVMKPDERIFRIALDAMGLDPGDAWYIGDMPAIDAVGATRSGLRPFIIDPLAIHKSDEYTPVESLAALAALVEAA